MSILTAIGEPELMFAILMYGFLMIVVGVLLRMALEHSEKVTIKRIVVEILAQLAMAAERPKGKRRRA